jgi:hypothetical protein
VPADAGSNDALFRQPVIGAMTGAVESVKANSETSSETADIVLFAERPQADLLEQSKP